MVFLIGNNQLIGGVYLPCISRKEEEKKQCQGEDACQGDLFTLALVRMHNKYVEDETLKSEY